MKKLKLQLSCVARSRRTDIQCLVQATLSPSTSKRERQLEISAQISQIDTLPRECVQRLSLYGIRVYVDCVIDTEYKTRWIQI